MPSFTSEVPLITYRSLCWAIANTELKRNRNEKIDFMIFYFILNAGELSFAWHDQLPIHAGGHYRFNTKRLFYVTCKEFSQDRLVMVSDYFSQHFPVWAQEKHGGITFDAVLIRQQLF